MADSSTSDLQGTVDASSGMVTVAVCTVGRPTLTKALSNLTAGATEAIAEVLVVDNTRESTLDQKQFSDVLSPLPLRVLRGPGGTSDGRNLALDQATTDVVLFFDDDCLPEPTWAAEFASYMASEPTVAAAYGSVEPVPVPGGRVLTDKAPGIGQSAWGETVGSDGEPRWCPAVTSPNWKPGITTSEPTMIWAVVGSSNNMALRRSLLLPGRPVFLPTLGPGTGTGSGEDTEFGYALMADGRALAHVPQAILRHDSWLGPKDTEWTERCYLRGTVEALGHHVLRGDERASRLLSDYLVYFAAGNRYGFQDLGEILEWAYGSHTTGQQRRPLRKSDLG